MVQVVAARRRRLGDMGMDLLIAPAESMFHGGTLGKPHRQGITIIRLLRLIIAAILTIRILVNMGIMVGQRGVTGQKMMEDRHLQDELENTDLLLPPNQFIGASMVMITTAATVMAIIIRTRDADVTANGIRRITMRNTTGDTPSIHLPTTIHITRLLVVDHTTG